ncbi:nucleolar transcription factor 1-A-like [Ischnura elegans]|uniref:nucleolar transcription factor 1-A-like n=1 Tax=Ischnura elegans TaxID=197161 RepID=UPI001ED8B4EE|nr:nucleolar transcription factor 1-A-like [Ischnura elegans]XP_046383912.1 nucleolar transcription factor 1-A-like [Ischnura elegans]
MVLDRKKRSAPQPSEASEIVAKKHKGEESRVPPPLPVNAKEGKESKSKKKGSDKSRPVKVERVEEVVEDAVVPVKQENNNDIPSWPEDHLWELMKRMEASIPARDSLRFDSRVEKLDWEEVRFGPYTGPECKAMWNKIQKRLRRYRLLRELLEDAKTWVTQPWTNFYRSTKQNRHPDLPRRPLSTYMLFYLEKKDRVAKEHPGLEMTAVSKHIALMYKNLSKKKKQKYIDKAAEERREYEEKLEEFYRLHPEMVPKSTPKDKPPPQMEPGPRRPCTPFKLYYLEKLKTHRDDPDFRQEKCKEMWKNVSDKKKLIWINRALEDETRYQAELKVYMRENPNFVPQPLKPVLTKDEKQLKERLAGKPEKPPNSGYSLFSRIMLASDEMKKYNSKGRMLEISKMWKDLSAIDKKKYHDKVQQMIDQYKLEYATYLESLPENERKEELLLTTHRKKKVVPEKPAAEKPAAKANSTTTTKAAPSASASSKKANDVKVQEKEPPAPVKDKKSKKEWKQTLYQGEPEPPPVTAFQLFLKSFMSDATHIPPATRMKEAPRYWEMLPESEKAKHRKKLGELKQKYIANYEKFLKGLSQEQLKEYSTLKSNCNRLDEMKEEEEEEEDSDGDDEDEDDDDEDDEDGRDGESVDGGEEEDEADDGDGGDESEEEDDDECAKNQANEGSDSSDDSSSGSDSDSDSSDSGSNNSDSDSDGSNSD